MSISQRPVDELVHRLQTTSSGRRPDVTRSYRVLTLLGSFAFILGIASALVGFLTNDGLALAASATLLGFGFVAKDVASKRKGEISPATLYAAAWTMASLANGWAIINQDTAARSAYFLYAIDEHLPVAMKIAWFGLVMPVIGFKWFMHSPTLRAFGSALPLVRGEVSDRQILPIGLAAAALGFVTKLTGVLPSLGTLTHFFGYLPHLAAFTLARRGVMRERPRLVWVGLAIAFAEALRAAVFAYLRSEVLAPMFAYAVGVLMGAPSLRALRRIYMAPVYAALIPFIVYFAAFADVRGRSSGGLARLEMVHEEQMAQIEVNDEARKNVLTRLSNINQLTQVARVVEEDGFLGGETLEYMAYAWIPRFLWPEKPIIAKGAWFAQRIGQARLVNGRPTNSINMTISGEFYMNFGWMGALLGPLAFGGFLALLWNTTSFWASRENVIGPAFGFYLLWVGVIGGADVQIVVTMIAMYLMFLAAGALFSKSTVTRGAPSRKTKRAVAAGGNSP